MLKSHPDYTNHISGIIYKMYSYNTTMIYFYKHYYFVFYNPL